MTERLSPELEQIKRAWQRSDVHCCAAPSGHCAHCDVAKLFLELDALRKEVKAAREDALEEAAKVADAVRIHNERSRDAAKRLEYQDAYSNKSLAATEIASSIRNLKGGKA